MLLWALGFAGVSVPSVTNGVELIDAARLPSKVGQMVVRRVVIPVQPLESFRALTNERFEYQAVHEDVATAAA